MNTQLEKIFLDALAENKDRVFRICISYANNYQDAQDLFQEVLLNCWKSLPTFKHKSNIGTWIYRIAINVCLKEKKFSLKKERHMVKLDSISFENIKEEVDQTDDERLFIKLSECIKKLDGVNKSIVLLHLEGLSHKDIAESTGLTENHIAVKIKRIKSKLLTCIKS